MAGYDVDDNKATVVPLHSYRYDETDDQEALINAADTEGEYNTENL